MRKAIVCPNLIYIISALKTKKETMPTSLKMVKTSLIYMGLGFAIIGSLKFAW